MLNTEVSGWGQGTSGWVRAQTDLIRLGSRAARIAHGPCLNGYTTPTLVGHEEEVHVHEHANSRAKTTSERSESVSPATKALVTLLYMIFYFLLLLYLKIKIL
jgi:hypothetical protein